MRKFAPFLLSLLLSDGAMAYSCKLTPEDCKTIEKEWALRDAYLNGLSRNLSTLSPSRLQAELTRKGGEYIEMRANILPKDLALELLKRSLCDMYERNPALAKSQTSLKECDFPSIAYNRSGRFDQVYVCGSELKFQKDSATCKINYDRKIYIRTRIGPYVTVVASDKEIVVPYDSVRIDCGDGDISLWAFDNKYAPHTKPCW